MVVFKTSMGVFFIRHHKQSKNIRLTTKYKLLLFAKQKYISQNNSKIIQKPTKKTKKKQSVFLGKKFQKRVEKYKKLILLKLGIKRKRGRPRKKKPLLQRFFITEILVDIIYSFIETVKNFKTFTAISIAISLILFGGTFWVHDAIFKNLPEATDLTQKEQSVTTKILDRNGEVLFRIYENENRSIIPLEEIPDSVIAATIAIEDKDFFIHKGFSMSGIIRAAVSNAQGKSLQGGSTITQQLVKNRLLTSERTVTRKLKELLLSVLVEIQYPKEEILEMYLNQVPYGGNAYGIEEAAQKFFAKSARDLTLAESALLAGLPQSPSTYTPFGANPELAYTRQEEVLRRMVEDEYISIEQAEQAKKEPFLFNEDRIDIKAPHFVMYIKKQLAKQFGEDILNNGGLEVQTSLDFELQKETEKIVQEEIDSLAYLNVQNGAAIVTNPKTGEILSMVGSKDYFDFVNDGQVNVTLRPRQPGSSIKPVTYALAIENGKTTQDLIDDSPITYHTVGSKPYSPQNYDGKFHGKVTLKEALASSYNIPAVKTLAENGISNMIDLAEAMGISTWQDRSRFGLSLTLGGGEVTMADMTEVYGTFANMGDHVSLNPILRITDYNGTLYYENRCALYGENCVDSQPIKPETAYLITNILSDNTARTPAFGPLSTLHIPNQEVAVKTGTTNNLRDNWTIGYTSEKLVAVWVGNNDNSSMSYVASGITGASPIWNEIMRLQLTDENPHQFTLPTNIIEAKVCKNQRYTSCTYCSVSQLTTEYFVPGTEQKYSCEYAQNRIKELPKQSEIKNNLQNNPLNRGQLTPATNTTRF